MHTLSLFRNLNFKDKTSRFRDCFLCVLTSYPDIHTGYWISSLRVYRPVSTDLSFVYLQLLIYNILMIRSLLLHLAPPELGIGNFVATVTQTNANLNIYMYCILVMFGWTHWMLQRPIAAQTWQWKHPTPPVWLWQHETNDYGEHVAYDHATWEVGRERERERERDEGRQRQLLIF